MPLTTDWAIPPGAITARGLRKSYGDKVVLDGIDLDIPAGTIFALLGPNGAGKTTTVQILSTLVAADGGTAHVAGHDLATDANAIRSRIGVTGQFAALDGLLTGQENLHLMADLNHLGRREGRQRAADLLERFELTESAKKMVMTYSGGMKRKLDLAMTLIAKPSVVFLDEPTTGLDPRSRRTMWELIGDLVADGVTIFLTTQYLEEADQLADRIAVLDHGKVIAQGTAEELKRQVPGGHIRLSFADEAALTAAAKLFDTVTLDTTTAPALKIPSDGSIQALRTVLDLLDKARIEALELSVHLPDLDDVFLALTGKPNPSPSPDPSPAPAPAPALELSEENA